MNGENDTMYYVHKDYLGSYDVITDEGGNVLERLSFDPWGRRRNPVDWTFDNLSANHLFDRGYTGHEHLDVFSLINMNGRVYDPWMGRFLSPDPFVQSPGYSQSYNRYSYCFNNPLKFSDPGGYKALLLPEEKLCHTYSSPTPSVFRIGWNTSPYRYDWNTGKYYNSQGRELSWDEVNVNYVQPNSISFNSYISSLISSNRKHSNQQNQVNANNLLADIREALLNKGDMMFNGTLEEVITEDDPVVFDVDKAINYLKAHFILPYGAGRCINHMVPALIAGGITGLDGKPIKAPCLYVPILEDLGFVIVNRTDIYYKGDIAIIQGYATGTYCKGSGVVCGHIQLYDGEHWLSDFPQDRPFWPGAGYEKYHPSFQIMHWGGN